jgi:O-antigen/teichoic acid export membrane protein
LAQAFVLLSDVPVPPSVFADTSDGAPKLIARNVGSRYAALVIDTVIGFLLLPFNLAHLGPAAYGVWMLTASVTIHFSLLDLGFGSAFVRFVAQYRARANAQAINEIASTLFFLFAAVGAVSYLIAAAVAFNLDHLFRLTPEQAETGKWLLLILGAHVAMTFPFSIYGGVVNGFQRYNVNSLVAIACSVLVALINITVLSAGLGLLVLVFSTTAVKLAFFFVYRANAHRIYPALQIRPSLVRRGRLREVMGFSVYTLLLDIGYRLSYQLDQLVIGSFLGTTAIAVWAPPTRIATATQQLTNQMNPVLFPTIVAHDAAAQTSRLQQILLQGTRLSLATVLPVAVPLVALAGPIIHVWVGRELPQMSGAVPVLQVLALVTVIRVGAGTATTFLKGANRHQLLAAASVATGIANLALSVALVRPLGLTGVALGTLIPLALSTMFVVFPAACRRAGLSLWRLISHSILPATWPAVVVGAVYELVLPAPPERLSGIALQAILGGVLYLALFAGVAISSRDRALYLSLARSMRLERPLTKVTA